MAGGTVGIMTWEYNETTRVLTISGNGAMISYSTASNVPWYDYIPNVSRIVIKDGITSIGEHAFYAANRGSTCTSISIPSTVTSIGNRAFWNLDKVTSPIFLSNVTTIGDYAFKACWSIPEIRLGENLTSVGREAFSECKNVKKIVFRGPKPTLSRDAFSLGFANTSSSANNAIAVVYSSGWASSAVFTPGSYGVIGQYTALSYMLLKDLPPSYSVIPVNVMGVWRASIPRVMRGGVWKELVGWCKDNGVWHRIGGDYEGYDGFAIFFDANGGEGTISPILTDSSARIPDNGFTRSGYVFVGWNTASDGSGTTYSVGQSVTLTANLTLYAIWARQYAVSFNANGGTGTVSTITSTSATITLPANAFSRSGYKFTGWNTAADGSGTSYVPGQVITVSSDLVLYAIWIQQFTISYYKSFNVSYESAWGSPTNYNGSVTDDNGNYHYLLFAVSGSIVPGLLDSFQSNKVSPTYSVTASKGDLFFIQLITKKGTAAVNEIYVNGTRVAGPAQVITWYMDGGVQSNMSIKFEWHTKGTIWSTSDYYWICYITTS